MKKNVAFLGVFLSLALIFSYVESLIPFAFGVPGMKLGLANSLVITLIYIRSKKEAFLINLGRILLSGLLFGNPFSIAYSLAGGVLSFIGMVFLKEKVKLNIISVSIAGAILHNLGQILVAMAVLKTASLMYYMSLLLISGFITGALMGLISREIIRRVK